MIQTPGRMAWLFSALLAGYGLAGCGHQSLPGAPALKQKSKSERSQDEEQAFLEQQEHKSRIENETEVPINSADLLRLAQQNCSLFKAGGNLEKIPFGPPIAVTLPLTGYIDGHFAADKFLTDVDTSFCLYPGKVGIPLGQCYFLGHKEPAGDYSIKTYSLSILNPLKSECEARVEITNGRKIDWECLDRKVAEAGSSFPAKKKVQKEDHQEGGNNKRPIPGQGWDTRDSGREAMLASFDQQCAAEAAGAAPAVAAATPAKDQDGEED